VFKGKGRLIPKLSTFLAKYGAYKNEVSILKPSDIEKCLVELRGSGKVIIEINEEKEECVYLKNFNFIENRIVSLLKKLIEEPKTSIATKEQIEEFILFHEKTHSFKFAEKQKTAIFMSLLNGISILTGRPGTGKTQTINSIIQCVKYINPHATIHLFAPTGKASKRMSELTGMDAMTIHRGIGLGFGEDEQDEVILDGDLLVIDETSMMDAYVCYRLLACIHQNIRVLFVGDFEQLPSVGAGLILRDFIYSKRIPTTRLTEIFRQAKESQIVMNAHKIAEGITTSDVDGLTFDVKKEDFYFIQRPDRMKAQETIIESVKRFLNKGFTLDDIQILSPMRKGDLGVWNLNRLMQETFNPRAKGKKEVKMDEFTFFREGDKVIHTVNNADLNVFNGEVGKILRIYDLAEEGLQVEVEYDSEKVVTYGLLNVDELEHAFVTTIHKSQGSEYPIVIMPVHDSQKDMLTRNLIYTAITRAKKKVVLIGTKPVLDAAIRRIDNLVRNSNIKEKIIREIAPMVA
jgi:exodeoxyribonuclease V alpha subunit